MLFASRTPCYVDVITYIHQTDTLKARIEVPAGTGPFPVVMAIHGGGFVVGDRTSYQSDFFAHYSDLGYAVVSTEYRMVSEGGTHPEPIRDCLHNLYWLIDHAGQYDFDTEFIVVHGSSAGAYLAMMLGLTADMPDFQPDFGPYQGRTARVKAVISSGGIFDWSWVNTSFGDNYIGSSKDDPAASPIYRAGDSNCPNFLLLGGDGDWVWSPPPVAEAMQESLAACGYYSELHLRADTGHPSFYTSTCGYCQWAFALIDPFLEEVVDRFTGIGADGLPARDEILSISPNPFNPRATIRFRLEETTRLNLALYSPRGALVTVLFDGIGAAGMHDTVWNGTNRSGRRVASGIYLLRLETDRGGETRKMVLVE